MNDVRIAAELDLAVKYFFAYWELPGIRWKQSIIPDAIFGVSDLAFAVEFDRGQENLRFFFRTKLAVYKRGLADFPLHTLLIVTDRQTRLEALARVMTPDGARVLLTRLDLLQKHGLAAAIFLQTGHNSPVKLL